MGNLLGSLNIKLGLLDHLFSRGGGQGLGLPWLGLCLLIPPSGRPLPRHLLGSLLQGVPKHTLRVLSPDDRAACCSVAACCACTQLMLHPTEYVGTCIQGQAGGSDMVDTWSQQGNHRDLRS